MQNGKTMRFHFPMVALILTLCAGLLMTGCTSHEKKEAKQHKKKAHQAALTEETPLAPVDTAMYRIKLDSLANGDTTGRWPVKGQPFPNDGAILPFKRIVAYYGNLFSKRMGVLGEYPPKELWRKLRVELKAWEKADPTTPTIPAIHYIASVAQGAPQKDNSYIYRMPDQQIDSALAIAKMGDALVFLDLQVGHSNVRKEVPHLEKYLKLPQVHLGIDPEFSMKDGSLPGRKIGNMDASDVNFCSDYLAKLVRENNLPPKVLIVHRFTQGMLKNYKDIRLHPEVQIVINMDGWGEPILKFSTYKSYIYREPVQFTGFKLFYKNDIKKPPHRMLTPEEILTLKPHPVYIQYQ
jgi:hypothetical protein